MNAAARSEDVQQPPHLPSGLGDARAPCVLFTTPSTQQREDSSLEPEPWLTPYHPWLDVLSQFTALNEEPAEPLLARGRSTGYGAAHTNPSLPDLLGPGQTLQEQRAV